MSKGRLFGCIAFGLFTLYKNLHVDWLLHVMGFFIVLAIVSAFRDDF